MLTFEGIFLTCIKENYSYNKMAEVVKYLNQELEHALDEDRIQSEVRILILTMLLRGSSLDKRVVSRYNKKHEKSLPVTKASLAFALGAGTEICLFDVVPYDFVYIIDRQLDIPDEHTCIVKSDLEIYHPKMARVTYVTFENNAQIDAILRETK